MTGRSRHFLFLAAVLGILLLLHTSDSSAQSAYTITLSSFDTRDFPHLEAYLDVHDPVGDFAHGLASQDVTIQENGIQVPVDALAEEKPGVQFVVAIAPGATFTIRDGAGVSRYEYLLQGMLSGSWASQPTDRDDYSLLTAGGPQITHTSNPSVLRTALESFQPPETDAAPNLEVLSAAIQLVSDPTARPGMERAILFITPPQPPEVTLGLQSVMTSANQQNIHIFVWLVAPQEAFSLPDIELLRNLALQTRAGFFEFSHDEAVPDLESILEPLRYVYQLDYASRVTSTGTWQVIAQVTLAGEQVDSAPTAFEINLQPPTVEILNPPSEIERSLASQPSVEPSDAVSNMQPQEQQLSIRITFSDGHIRELARTSLFVDGAIVAENSNPPFEQLVWDLRPYIQAGTHTLKVEATDNLGLVGKTSEISVKIVVPSKTMEMVAVVSKKPLVVIGLIVFTVITILLLVLIVAGRIQPKLFPGQVRRTFTPRDNSPLLRWGPNNRQLSKPEVTSSNKTAPPTGIKSILRRWLVNLPRVQKIEEPTTTLAYLDPLTGSDEPTLPSSLQIASRSITLGHDPQKADLVIVDPSIEGLHATICQEGLTFRIMDSGSVAGTWVNYSPVPASGTELRHADIIHLGQVGFRFDLPDPGIPGKITVSPLEPDL